MKLTGVFKTYEDLRLAYGLAPEDTIDDEFGSFLKIIAGQDAVLANYNPISLTFDTTLMVDNPDYDATRPTSPLKVFGYLDGRSRRYGDNMGIDKLATIDKEDAEDYIYCTHCGFTIAKETRYDYEPLFSYGDIYNNNIDGHPNNPTSITGVTIKFKAHKDGFIMCPQDRAYQRYDEVGNTLP